MRIISSTLIILGSFWFNSHAQVNCLPSGRSATLDINNVKANLNLGNSFFNRADYSPGYEVPKVRIQGQRSIHAIFESSLWLSGYDSVNRELNGFARLFSTGPAGLSAGPIQLDANNMPRMNEDQCRAWSRLFQVNRQEIEVFKNSWQPGISTGDIPTNVLLWPGKSNPHLPLNIAEFTGGGVSTNHDLAPFFDLNGDGIYNPVQGDYPQIKGDASVWWVMNDMGRAKVFPNGNALRNLGLEVQVEAFAISNPVKPWIDNTTFYHVKVLNKSPVTLHRTHVGFFMDGDLGNGADDYVQSDVMRGMGILYNGDNEDENPNGNSAPFGYGSNTPALGFDYLDGVLADPNDGIDNDRNGVVDEPEERIPMSNFIGFNNSNNPRNGDPRSFIEFSNYLQTKWRDGLAVAYRPDGIGFGPPTTFLYPDLSDPYGFSIGGSIQNPRPMGSPWSENTMGTPPGDRRLVGSMGPFRFSNGSTAEFTMAVIWSLADSANNPLASVRQLKVDDDSVQAWFNAGMPFISAINVSNKPIVQNFEFQVYPNPAKHEISLSLPWSVEPFQVNISDVFGRRIMNTKALGGNLNIDVHQLTQGLYLIEISKNGQKSVRKFIKQ